MGTLSPLKTKSGKLSYRAEVRLEGKRLTKCFQRKTDAREWIREQETRIRRGESIALPKRHTLADAIERYRIEVLPLKRERVQTVHEGQLAWWMNRLGARRLADITSAELSEARETLRTESVPRGKGKAVRSPSTVNRYLQIIAHVLNVANRDWQWLHHVPRVQRLKEPSGRTRFLRRREIPAVLEALDRAPADVRQVSRISMRLGTRLEETCALQWTDIDFDAGTIRFTVTKSGKVKVLPLGEGLSAELLRWKEQSAGGSSYLFPVGRESNRPYVYDKVRKWFRKLAKELGLRDVSFHNLRHTVGSLATQAGTNRRTVAELLGHARVTTTDRYSHLDTEHLKPIVDLLEEFIGSGRSET